MRAILFDHRYIALLCVRAVGTGLVGMPACGDVMRLQFKVDGNGIITETAFKVIISAKQCNFGVHSNPFFSHPTYVRMRFCICQQQSCDREAQRCLLFCVFKHFNRKHKRFLSHFVINVFVVKEKSWRNPPN